ncbi:MAG: HAD-IC family P-type ATPase, partial [Caedimonadaceae bacterium]
PLKPGVVEAIQQLYARGFEVIMATGDHPTTAQFIAQRVGIQEYYAGVLPQQKVEVLEKIRQKHAKVAMAGDGVNDAPALVMSDVGIAMGTGSDVAIESSDIVLVRGDLSLISKSYDLAKNIVSNIKQNLFFAFIYNILGIPIAAGLFYPLFGVVLDPMVAAAAMSVSSICVIGNALRLKS